MGARARSDPEVSLFPFLSILVCLIGALVLLIVILTIVQSATGGGRDPEEFQRAKEADRLRREVAALEKKVNTLFPDRATAEKLKQELTEKTERFVTLRKVLSASAEDRKRNEQTHAELQKELENIVLQLEQMKKEEPPIKAEIEKLKAEIASRKKNIDAKPKLVVQPTGSGVAGAGGDVGELFFVECNAGGIVIHRKGEEPLRITSGSIGTDAGYDEFLKKVAATPKSQLLFLLRQDGLATYNRAAGWAEATFNVRTGKIPLPGQGEIDLSRFQTGG